MKSTNAWLAKHKLTVVAVAVLVSVVALSAVLWFPATNGSKEADLASALLSGVVVGAVLIVVGKAFNEVATQGQANAGMQASDNPEPAQDSPGSFSATEPEVRTGAGMAAFSFAGHARGVVAPPARNFRVVYEDWQRDTSRIDAVQIRLRLFEGDRYFQFVTVVVPAPELRRLIGADPDVSQGRLWWHIAREAEAQLADAIRRGEIPKSDPTIAYEVQTLDIDSAVRLARHDASNEVTAGEPIYSFTVESNEELLTRQQFNQVLGYDTILVWSSTGAREYEVVLSRPLTDDQKSILQTLATERDFHATFTAGEDRWEIGPRQL